MIAKRPISLPIIACIDSFACPSDLKIPRPSFKEKWMSSSNQSSGGLNLYSWTMLSCFLITRKTTSDRLEKYLTCLRCRSYVEFEDVLLIYRTIWIMISALVRSNLHFQRQMPLRNSSNRLILPKSNLSSDFSTCSVVLFQTSPVFPHHSI